MIIWIKSGKISKGYVTQLNQNTKKSKKANIFQIFSFEIAKIPRVKPIPLNIKAIRKKIPRTINALNTEIGWHIIPNIKNKVNGIDIVINRDKKIPNNKLTLLKGPIIRAVRVFQYISFRNWLGKIVIISLSRIIL